MYAMRAKQESGFTLIELMIVMAVIAVLVGSIIPVAKIYKERAYRSQALQGGRCLQTSFVALDTLTTEERTATIRKLGGTSAEFYEASERMGCRLGPTLTSPRTKPIVDVDDCRVRICRDEEVVRDVGCSLFDENQLGPDEVECGMYVICTMGPPPGIPGLQLEVTDHSLEMRTH